MRSLWTAQALYDGVVARYSSPATAALGRLLLPYLFPELSAFATVEDLVSHLRTSDARYCAALPAEFLERNLPLMYITLYLIVTRLPDSICAVRDHFLALDPTALTVDLLEQHLLAAETSVVAVGAARGTQRTPFFEGCSPSPLAPSYASAAAVDVLGAEDIGAASSSAKHCSSKGKGGRGGGGGRRGGSGGSSGVGGGSGGGGSDGSGGGSGGFGGGGGGSGGIGGSGSGESGGRRTGAPRGGFEEGQRQQQQCPSETPSTQQLREWFAQRGASGGLELVAAALGASESVLPCTAPAEALHTFTLDSGASCCFFRDSTTLTPLSAPVPVRLADPSGGPVLARSSIVLPCLAVPSGSLSLPPLPPSPAPPCLPCVKGQQRAAPHSSSFPPTSAPLQTLHMDMWGPSPHQWTGPHALLSAVRLQLRERFRADHPVLRLHSEFSSDLLRDFCHGEGILQSFTLPDSPQQNGIAKRCMGLVMEVARTSMIHAAAFHFLWPFSVQ
ncbi:unnamed protein product [Closterium sp. NIES-54]